MNKKQKNKLNNLLQNKNNLLQNKNNQKKNKHNNQNKLKQNKKKQIVTMKNKKNQQSKKRKILNIQKCKNQYHIYIQMVLNFIILDQYLSLIPMVAPYPVVGNNKFKIKMAPGSLKKGKGNKLNKYVQLEKKY